MKITRVRRMADLPAELARNVRTWPHYPATSETDPADAYTITYRHGRPDEHTMTYDPLVSENGERGEWRLTGYAYAGETADGHRLWVLRMNESTFTYGYMTPGSTGLNVGSVNEAGTKASILAWVEQQHALDVAPAAEAGTIAYNVGRPNTWDEHVPGGWGERRITDPNMERLVQGVWGLARHRLGRAFSDAWEANAEHDRQRATAAPAYTYLAAQQAFKSFGKDYADYIEQHTAELVAKGYDVAHQSLGEALVGNDGD